MQAGIPLPLPMNLGSKDGALSLSLSPSKGERVPPAWVNGLKGSRRHFLRGVAVGSMGTFLGCRAFRTKTTAATRTERVFHLSIAIEAFETDPDLIPTLSRAGVGHIWLAPFL